MSILVKITEAHDLPQGTGIVCTTNGMTLALFNVDGTFHAVNNSCPHRAGRLGEGKLDGSTVTCPQHGWRFDVTTGDCLGRPGRKIQSYPVHLKAGEVWLDLPISPERGDETSGDLFLIRFGAMGHVGKFLAHAPIMCSRGSRVVVQSSRGLELGEVLLAAGQDASLVREQPDCGRLLREMTRDDLIVDRELQKGQQQAFEACRKLIDDGQLTVELVDAEQLFDGQTIIFYFLGDPPPALADVTAELARQYEAQVQFRPFGESIEQACGTGCGKDAEHGCGSCGENGECGSGGCSA